MGYKTEKKHMKELKKERLKRYWTLILFLVLTVISIFIFSYIPMYGILISWHDYMPGDEIIEIVFFGIDCENIKTFLRSYHFKEILVNTFLISVLGFLVVYSMPIIVALIEDSNFIFHNLEDLGYVRFDKISTLRLNMEHKEISGVQWQWVALSKLAKENDKEFLEAFIIQGNYLGKSLSIDILNPEVIVMCGVYMQNEKLLYQCLYTTLSKEVIPLSLSVCEIKPSRLGKKIDKYNALVISYLSNRSVCV